MDEFHPHTRLNESRVPAGIPRMLAATHRYRVFLLGMDNGEFHGMDAGLLEQRSLTIGQAVAECDRVDVWFATHTEERSGAMFGVILDIAASLHWVDDIERFGLYMDHDWYNREWMALGERCRQVTGWEPGQGRQLRAARRPKVLALLAAQGKSWRGSLWGVSKPLPAVAVVEVEEVAHQPV